MSRQSLGKWGEDFAEKFLNEKGYVIIDRNVRTQYGEIDIVAKKENVVVFVEVKTRSSLSYGYPEEAITQVKKEHLLKSAEMYLLSSPYAEHDWRIDVIAIQFISKDQPPALAHFQNAVA